MISQPPKGFNLLKVLGPGLVWSASAIASAVFFLFFIGLFFWAVIMKVNFSM